MKIPPVRDDDVRMSCFLSLEVLQARFGEDIPYPARFERFVAA